MDMPTIRKAGYAYGKKLPNPHSKHVKIETLLDREAIAAEMAAGRIPVKASPRVYFEPDPAFRKISNMRSVKTTMDEPVAPGEIEPDQTWKHEGWRPSAYTTVLAQAGRRVEAATKSYGTQRHHLGMASIMSANPVPYSTEARSVFTKQALVETDRLGLPSFHEGRDGHHKVEPRGTRMQPHRLW